METSGGHVIRHNECRQIPSLEVGRAQWFGENGTLYMGIPGILPDTWQPRHGKPVPANIPDYWNSEMPPAMRHQSGHGGSHTFLAAEFVNALLENREPAVNVYEALAMTVPGLVAHQINRP